MSIHVLKTGKNKDGQTVVLDYVEAGTHMTAGSGARVKAYDILRVRTDNGGTFYGQYYYVSVAAEAFKHFARLTAQSLWEAVQAYSEEYDYHESDLYLPDTPLNRSLCDRFGLSYETFHSNLPADQGARWLEIPFQYLPYWEERDGKARRKRGTGQIRSAV